MVFRNGPNENELPCPLKYLISVAICLVLLVSLNRIPKENVPGIALARSSTSTPNNVETRHGPLLLVETEPTADLMHAISSSSSTGLAR